MPFIYTQSRESVVGSEPLVSLEMSRSGDTAQGITLLAPPQSITLHPFPGSQASAEQSRTWAREVGEFIGVVTDRAGDARFLLDLSGVITEELLGHVLSGVIDGIGGISVLEQLSILVLTDIDRETFRRTLQTELSVRRGVELARSLTDARANQLTPAGFAEIARELAEEHGLGFRRTDADGLTEGGFGCITAIGSGSSRPPVLVEIWIPGADGDRRTPPKNALALAGKGITFDSGGLSLKGPDAMYGMHTDCAGAATVLGALVALAEQGCELPVYAALPLAENVPGPDSVRPGDVVTARNGVGVEIVDTDFEGRVVLSDALSLLCESQPRAVISLATLTYQAIVALGPDIGALLSRDERLAERMIGATRHSGEALWRLPWATRYRRQVESRAPGATVRNHPRADSGRAITAALFLGEFVAPEVPFAHVDFAGPAVTTKLGAPEATGYGVDTLFRLVSQWS